MGKVPVGVATLAKKHGKPVIAVAGSIADDASHTHAYGIDAFFPIVQAPCSLSDAMNDANAYRNLKRTAEEIFRLWKTISPT
jgi:glycerate kinase